MDFYAKSNVLWYFAYGSNMSTEKFTGSRGVIPLDEARIRLPNWEMVMEIPGLPYSEPAFSSIRLRDEEGLESAEHLDVIGIAYLITARQFRNVVASEGGGTAYIVARVAGEGVTVEDQEKLSNGAIIKTLVSSKMTRVPTPRPSVRYMVHIQFHLRS